MARYTYQQLKDLWTQAGGNPVFADMAAAVALAESGGDPNSTNVNQGGSAPGSVDRGLWQINSQYHPAESTYDPMANARGAVTISQNGTNWRPWCTAWSDGRCGGTFMGDGAPVKRYLPGGQVVTGNVPTNGVQSAVLTGSGGTSGTGGLILLLGGLFNKAAAAVGQTIASPQDIAANILKYIVWAVFMVVGSFLMTVGLVILILGSRPGRAAGRAVLGLGGTAAQATVTKRVYYGKSPKAQPRTQPAFVQQPPAPAAPVSAAPASPAPTGPTAPQPAPKKPYRARHRMMFEPAAPGEDAQFFRQGGTRRKPRRRARQAQAGRDYYPGAGEPVPPTPNYQPRHGAP